MTDATANSVAKFRTIVADPPWPYRNRENAEVFAVIPKSPVKNGSRLQRNVRETGYPLMEMDDLLALRPPADTNAHLYLWTTNSFMDEAHDVARAWGFTPKTILTWAKTHQGDRSRVSMKTGYYFRGATEHCIFGVRGSLRLQTTDGLPTAYLWPRIGQHSAKPDAFYDLVEQASPGPYLELFARRARFGWSYWGNESLETAEMPA